MYLQLLYLNNYVWIFIVGAHINTSAAVSAHLDQKIRKTQAPNITFIARLPLCIHCNTLVDNLKEALDRLSLYTIIILYSMFWSTFRSIQFLRVLEALWLPTQCTCIYMYRQWGVYTNNNLRPDMSICDQTNLHHDYHTSLQVCRNTSMLCLCQDSLNTRTHPPQTLPGMYSTYNIIKTCE